MTWHDTLAARSAEQGRTSADFRAGARRKAKATILFLLLAGIVVYLVAWPWALLPAALAAWSAFQCRSALLIAARLEAMEAQSQEAQSQAAQSQPDGGAPPISDATKSP
jgi:Flp pilus assembly protein TadB